MHFEFCTQNSSAEMLVKARVQRVCLLLPSYEPTSRLAPLLEVRKIMSISQEEGTKTFNPCTRDFLPVDSLKHHPPLPVGSMADGSPRKSV